MKTPRIVRDVLFAVEGARSARPAAVDTLCCGTLGNVELFCEAANVLGRSDLRDLALQRLTDVFATAASSGDYRWNSGNGSSIWVCFVGAVAWVTRPFGGSMLLSLTY